MPATEPGRCRTRGHLSSRWHGGLAVVSAATAGLMLAVSAGTASASPFRAGAVSSPARTRPLAAQVNSKAGDGFGSAVSVSGSFAAVAAPFANDLTGAVYVFARGASGWHQQTTLRDPEPGGEFGISVAVSGKTIAVGAWGNDGGKGMVYVYAWSGRRWYIQARLSGTQPPPCDTCGAGDFGESVAISGNYLAVSEPVATYGPVFVYARSAGGGWRQQMKLGDGGSRDNATDWGSSVAITGTTLVIGASQANSNRGAAFVYARAGSAWHRRAKLVGTPGCLCGARTSLSGSTLAVGGYSTLRNKARGYIYARSGGKWRLQGSLTTPAGKTGDTQYWTSVAVSGSRALVGDPLPNPHQCGAAYEYARTGSHWRQRAKLVNPGCVAGDQFGYSVALAGTTALIGAAGWRNDAGQAYVQTVP
jgi:FG-GAP repeat